jgi:hypothetical protein
MDAIGTREAVAILERHGCTVPLGGNTQVMREAATVIKKLGQDAGLKDVLSLQKLNPGDIVVIDDPEEKVDNQELRQIAKTLRPHIGAPTNKVMLLCLPKAAHIYPSDAAEAVRRLLPLLTKAQRLDLVGRFCLECGSLEPKCGCDTAEE